MARTHFGREAGRGSLGGEGPGLRRGWNSSLEGSRSNRGGQSGGREVGGAGKVGSSRSQMALQSWGSAAAGAFGQRGGASRSRWLWRLSGADSSRLSPYDAVLWPIAFKTH